MKYGNFLVIFLPATLLSYFLGGPPVLTFFTAAVALVYLAAAMGWATEVLAARAGPTVGGLLNATLGNGAELIIALVGVRAGLATVVKASLTGSILGNLLLVLGASLFVGGLRYKHQHYNPRAAGVGTTLLVIAVSALLMPSLFHIVTGGAGAGSEHPLSAVIAVALLIAYGANIVFTLVTHRDVFPHQRTAAAAIGSVKTAAVVMVGTTAGMVAAAEVLVRVIEPTAYALGWNDIFVGVVVVAIAGNAAEHFTAVLAAWRNKLDLTLTITQGSSVQIALLVAPLVVLLSYMWPRPLDLIFGPLEVAAIALSLLIISQVTADGESNWLEGLLLLVLYAIAGATFFFGG